MFAVRPAPSSNSAADGGLFLKYPGPQFRHPLGLDPAAASSSFRIKGGLLPEVASSLSSFSALSRSSPDGALLLLYQNHHNSHGFSFQGATHVQSLSRAVRCARKGVRGHNRHRFSLQGATHLSSLSRSGCDGLYPHHFQLQHHGLHIQAAIFPLGACPGNDNLLQQEELHLSLKLQSNFSCFVCVGNNNNFLQQQHSCCRLQAHSQQHLSLQEQQGRLLQQQQKQEITNKHQADILESIAKYQESLKNLAMVSTNSQIDPNARGYLPPEFDISSCRSVFVGNIHRRVTSVFLGEVFSTVGTLAGCKLIRKPKSSYGIVEYLDQRAAAVAIATLNGRQIFGLPIKVNWAYLKDQREDKTGHHTIFVGDLSAEITDAALFAFFISTYPSCSDVRVISNPRNGRSKGFGFVSFRDREDAEKAIEQMTGKMLGSRAIRCNWATEAQGGSEGQEATLKKGPENDSRFTTVHVSNLAKEVTEAELRKQFDMLELGVIENVRIPKKNNFGFVRYSTHEEAALAISAANGKIIGGEPVVCSWGTRRSPPEASSESHSLAPPVPTVEKDLPHEKGKEEG